MVGLVHIYCGTGKGKTTAAMGLALRCAGYGGRVLLMQFMKRDNSGERRILAQLPQVTLWETYPAAKFSFQMNATECAQAAAWYTAQFQQIVKVIQQGGYRMLVLDELLSCIRCGFLDESLVVNFLQQKPEELEVVITGRDLSEKLVTQADYVTEMTKWKHPYDQGIPARQGVEF